jgi:hypothetical protein
VFFLTFPFIELTRTWRAFTPSGVSSSTMNRPNRWLAAGISGFAVMALSIVMAFVDGRGGYYGYPKYQWLLAFERVLWWFQLSGAVLSIVGCIGMSIYLTERIGLLIGFGGILAALIVTLLFGGAILNVHSWTIALILPIFLTFVNSGVPSVVGLVRLNRAGRSVSPRAKNTNPNA